MESTSIFCISIIFTLKKNFYLYRQYTYKVNSFNTGFRGNKTDRGLPAIASYGISYWDQAGAEIAGPKDTICLWIC